MDEKEQDHVAAFDLLFTTNQIQIMKILLPCLTPSIQKYLAVYIKYQELQYTLSCINNPSFLIYNTTIGQPDSFQKLIPSLLPYCTEKQKEMIQQFEQILSSMETYREMMEMMQMMQSMSENTDSACNPFSSENSQMTDMEMLLSLLNPEQQGIMELLKGGFQNE